MEIRAAASVGIGCRSRPHKTELSPRTAPFVDTGCMPRVLRLFFFLFLSVNLADIQIKTLAFHHSVYVEA